MNARKMCILLCLSASIAVFAGYASSQTPIPCEKYSNPNEYYFGPDHQYLVPSNFSLNDFIPPENSVPYLKRIAQILRYRGVLPTVLAVPKPGFFYLGKLDSRLIKGTVFEKLSSTANLIKLRDSYVKSIRYLESLGFEVPNVLDGMRYFVNANPGSAVFLKRDGHWHPNGANSAAKAIANAVSAKYPETFKSIHTNDYKLVKSGIGKLPDGMGFDGVIKKSCPNHVPFNETWDTFELKKAGSNVVSQQELFGAERQDVVLVGTSYSTPNYQSGFSEFLSAEFGSPVVNYSLAGGGPLGSLLEYFMSLDDLSNLPKLLIWEIPGYQINVVSDSIKSLPFLPAYFRQLLPVMNSREINGTSSKVKLAKSTEIQVGFKENTDCINIKFSDLNTRKVKLKLVYRDKSEEIELLHPRIKSLNNYYLELLKNIGELEKITIEADGQPVGDVEVTPLVYN
jgi:hypothetical protein